MVGCWRKSSTLLPSLSPDGPTWATPPHCLPLVLITLIVWPLLVPVLVVSGDVVVGQVNESPIYRLISLKLSPIIFGYFTIISVNVKNGHKF